MCSHILASSALHSNELSLLGEVCIHTVWDLTQTKKTEEIHNPQYGQLKIELSHL